MNTRIALADDQALVLKGLRSLLDDMAGISVVVEAQSGGELLAALADQAVDLVISDIRMPGMDGIALTKALRAQQSDTPVLLLTTFDDQDLMLAAVDAGAQGFLLKDISPEDLAAAIADIMAGRSLLQPVSPDPVRQRYAYHDDNTPTDTFNDREVAILRLLAGGYSNKEIARSIHLAEGTVKNYVSDILAKLETRDRTRAVLKAITLRVI